MYTSKLTLCRWTNVSVDHPDYHVIMIYGITVETKRINE